MNIAVDMMLSLMVLLVWGYVVFLICVRLMERKTFWYTLAQTDDGFSFKYTLGVYAGRVIMIRDPLMVYPKLTVGVNGWECRFPEHYSYLDMCDHLQEFCKSIDPRTSHSKDVPIFNQVVNLKNDALISISGKIYTFDGANGQQLVV